MDATAPMAILLLLMAILWRPTHSEPLQQPIPRLPGVWNGVLWRVSNGTGLGLARDAAAEAILRQLFAESFLPAIKSGRPLLGTVLDPVWVWPVSDTVDNDVFLGDLRACDVHLHNIRSAKLVDVSVVRDATEEAAAVRTVLHFPILWLSGYYTLQRSFLFGFIPVKSRRGDFNIDVKDVTVAVVFTLKVDDETEEMRIGDFEMGVHWHKLAFMFERIAGRFSTLADLTINQLGIGNMIACKEKEKIRAEIEDYARGVFSCAMRHPATGIQLCMRRYWEARGWTWPWRYPPCPRQ